MRRNNNSNSPVTLILVGIVVGGLISILLEIFTPLPSLVAWIPLYVFLALAGLAVLFNR